MTHKILHLITELDTGGAQKALSRLLARTNREQYELSVACLYNGDGAVAQEIRQMGIDVTDLKMRARWRLDAFWYLYRLLHSEKPDILHTWMFHANIPGRVLGWLAGIPVIISGERTMGQEGGWRIYLNRITYRFATRVTCVSQQVADFAIHTIRIPSDKVVLIPNGIDISSFDDLPTREDARNALSFPLDAPVIGIVTRLTPVKSVNILLKAAALLKDVNVMIIGDGSERKSLENLTEILGLVDRVWFAGYRQDVRYLLKAMDLFVLTSEWEGMPNSVLEAMATGLPVIATAVGGLPGVVLDGETGFLVPPGHPDALAAAIAQLMEDPKQRMSFGQAGRERVEKCFTIEETVQKTQSLYSELLGRSTP